MPGLYNVKQKQEIQRQVQVASADGAITIKDGVVVITKGSAAALTLASPTAGADDGKRLTIVATTAHAHTVTLTAGFGGGTTARDVATWGGAINDSLECVAYNGVWYAIATRNVTIA